MLLLVFPVWGISNTLGAATIFYEFLQQKEHNHHLLVNLRGLSCKGTSSLLKLYLVILTKF